MRSYIYNRNSVIGSQAEHCGMRTYFFSADTQEDMNGWIRAMNQAALMQQSHTLKRLVSLQLEGVTSTVASASRTSLLKVDANVKCHDVKNILSLELEHTTRHYFLDVTRCGISLVEVLAHQIWCCAAALNWFSFITDTFLTDVGFF